MKLRDAVQIKDNHLVLNPFMLTYMPKGVIGIVTYVKEENVRVYFGNPSTPEELWGNLTMTVSVTDIELVNKFSELPKPGQTFFTTSDMIRALRERDGVCFLDRGQLFTIEKVADSRIYWVARGRNYDSISTTGMFTYDEWMSF
jgi:hypothetical protein